MAEAAHEYHTGDMDISEQVSTFNLFGGLVKWGSLTIASLLMMLILWFCTPAGFLAGFITAAVIMALGIFFLREKPQDEHTILEMPTQTASGQGH